jgi:hypothetical protein
MASKDEKFTDYTIKSEVDFHVAEHQTLLSFNSDWQSEAFQDWLSSEGMKRFAAWLKNNKEKYQ